MNENKWWPPTRKVRAAASVSVVTIAGLWAACLADAANWREAAAGSIIAAAPVVAAYMRGDTDDNDGGL